MRHYTWQITLKKATTGGETVLPLVFMLLFLHFLFSEFQSMSGFGSKARAAEKRSWERDCLPVHLVFHRILLQNYNNDLPLLPPSGLFFAILFSFLLQDHFSSMRYECLETEKEDCSHLMNEKWFHENRVTKKRVPEEEEHKVRSLLSIWQEQQQVRYRDFAFVQNPCPPPSLFFLKSKIRWSLFSSTTPVFLCPKAAFRFFPPLDFFEETF